MWSRKRSRRQSVGRTLKRSQPAGTPSWQNERPVLDLLEPRALLAANLIDLFPTTLNQTFAYQGADFVDPNGHTASALTQAGGLLNGLATTRFNATFNNQQATLTRDNISLFYTNDANGFRLHKVMVTSNNIGVEDFGSFQMAFQGGPVLAPKTIDENDDFSIAGAAVTGFRIDNGVTDAFTGVVPIEVDFQGTANVNTPAGPFDVVNVLITIGDINLLNPDLAANNASWTAATSLQLQLSLASGVGIVGMNIVDFALETVTSANAGVEDRVEFTAGGVGAGEELGVTTATALKQTVSIAAQDATANEPGTDPVNHIGTFRITRAFKQSAATGDLTVNFSLAGGTAIRTTDYTLSANGVPILGTSVVIPDGDDFVDVVVTAVNDALVEIDETIRMTLLANANYNLATAVANRFAVVTLVDDEPFVNVTNQADGTEGGAAGTVRFTRVGSTVGDLTVRFVVGGTAISGRDYTSIGTFAVIPDGTDFVDVDINTIQDTLAESTETVIVTLLANAAYRLDPTVANRKATIELDDDEATVTAAAVALASEQGPTDGIIRFTRTGNTAAPLVVQYLVTGSARSGVDYSPLGNTVLIPAGSATADVIVSPFDDTIAESGEEVSLTVVKLMTYHVGTANKATIIIEDNEPIITVAPGAPEAEFEANADATVRFDNPDGANRDVNFGTGTNTTLGVKSSVQDGSSILKSYVRFLVTPAFDQPYSRVVFTLTIAPATGQSQPDTDWSFDVFGLPDGFVPLFNDPVPGTNNLPEQGNNWIEGTITDDTAPGSNILNSIEARAAFTGAPIADFTITGLGTPGAQIVIDSDVFPDVLDFLNSDTDGLVTFMITRSTLEPAPTEITEDVTHRFHSRESQIDDGPILNVFGPGADLTHTEGDLLPGLFEITRLGSDLNDVTVNFTIAGTARRGIDYNLVFGGAILLGNSITIPAASNAANIAVVTSGPLAPAGADDLLYEPDETVILNLALGTGYTLDAPQNRQQIMTIEDNESIVTMTATDDEASEPATTRDFGVFTFTRDGDTSRDLVVNFLVRGTALSGQDYVAIGNSVTIPAETDLNNDGDFADAGETDGTSVTVNIEALADNRRNESGESVTIELIPNFAYGLEWNIDGTNPQTGGTRRITVGAVNFAQAVAVGKAQGLALVVPDKSDQVDTVIITDSSNIPGVDLIGISMLAAAQTKSLAGSTPITGSAFIRNQGSTTVASSTVRFFLSADRAFDVSDIVLGDLTQPAIGAQQNVVIGFSFDVDLLAVKPIPGTYYIVMVIDVNGIVVEFDEANNEFATNNRVITITP